MSIQIVGRRAGISRGQAIITFERDDVKSLQYQVQIPTREKLNGFTTGRWLEYQIQKAAREANAKFDQALGVDTSSKLAELPIEHIRQYFPEVDHAR